MELKSAAGSQPAAGPLHARASLQNNLTEVKMNSPTNTNKPAACVDFALLSNYARQLAKTLDMDIVSFPDGFAAVKDGDVLCEECASKELEAWLNGYESGKDDSEIVSQLDHAKLVLAELLKAEQIIQTMMAAMTDAQKQAAANSLAVVGVGGAQSGCRSGERQAAILASRPASSGSAA